MDVPTNPSAPDKEEAYVEWIMAPPKVDRTAKPGKRKPVNVTESKPTEREALPDPPFTMKAPLHTRRRMSYSPTDNESAKENHQVYQLLPDERWQEDDQYSHLFSKPGNRSGNSRGKVADAKKEVVRELLERERQFNVNLQDCIDHFLKPLVGNSSIDKLIKNISNIREASSSFVDRLENSTSSKRLSAPRVGDHYLTLAKDIVDAYLSYCSDYGSICMFLAALVAGRHQSSMKTLGESLKGMSNEATMKSLRHSLAAPLNHLAKHSTSLQELMAFTDLDDPDFLALHQATMEWDNLQTMAAVVRRSQLFKCNTSWTSEQAASPIREPRTRATASMQPKLVVSQLSETCDEVNGHRPVMKHRYSNTRQRTVTSPEAPRDSSFQQDSAMSRPAQLPTSKESQSSEQYQVLGASEPASVYMALDKDTAGPSSDPTRSFYTKLTPTAQPDHAETNLTLSQTDHKQQKASITRTLSRENMPLPPLPTPKLDSPRRRSLDANHGNTSADTVSPGTASRVLGPMDEGKMSPFGTLQASPKDKSATLDSVGPLPTPPISLYELYGGDLERSRSEIEALCPGSIPRRAAHLGRTSPHLDLIDDGKSSSAALADRQSKAQAHIASPNRQISAHECTHEESEELQRDLALQTRSNSNMGIDIGTDGDKVKTPW